MLSRLSGTQLRRSDFNTIWNYVKYSTAVNVKPSAIPLDNSYTSTLAEEWQEAKPFSSIPGPSKFQMIRGFMRGGDFHDMPFTEFMQECRRRYGDIYLLPGMFGQNTNLITFNLNDYEKIFRTEGPYPSRPGNEIVFEYRLARKDGLYDEGNLGVAANGPQWGKFRHAVNPVLMQPRNTVLYINPTQKVNNDFIERIREIRNPSSLEVPEDFLSEIKRLAFESVAVIALDKDLGLVRNKNAVPEAQELFNHLQHFTKAFYDLGIKPSIYRYIKTPSYRRFENAMDSITLICSKFVDETLQRIEARGGGDHQEGKSVLEKLIKIDRRIAIIMAIDMLIAGVDTTSSVMAAVLLCMAKNPEKQEKLRQEILTNIGRTEKFTMENMKNLPYLRACIKESLRTYPLIAGNMRTTGQDLCLSGYQVPKGTNVFLTSNLLLQEDRYFPNAEKFMPERWLRSNNQDDMSAKNTNPFIFLPFGFGPRSCVGKRIVDLQLEITLANIVRNFKMEYQYSTENAFKNYFMNTCVIPLKFKFTDL
ncbi:probable cytochrome P450 12c1, mitochondrial [Musca vetustissima]|uniref:probable cytochrome P450 12c1, mitochondrial n=1 Tax=Musca vetustissima TaxID=27455 RepID=UPI002AB5F3A2|nr:probable cytochrome P450 12c1, mitochondrial [Musca vetustissima]